MKDEHIISCFAIAGIVVLEAIALIKGINGVLLSTTLSIIAAIVGYEIKGWINGKKEEKDN